MGNAFFIAPFCPRLAPLRAYLGNRGWMLRNCLTVLMSDFGTLILRRKPRESARWHEATSHIGGLPTLAGRDWPLGADGAPLPFIAQVDLAVISALRIESPLPKAGMLLFFARLDGEAEGAVRHVPLNREIAAPPEGMAPLYGAGFGRVFPFAPNPALAPRALPRWPLQIRIGPKAGDADAARTLERLARDLGGREERKLSAKQEEVARHLPQFDCLPFLGLHWNHSLHLYGNSLIQALHRVPALRGAHEDAIAQAGARPRRRRPVAEKRRWWQRRAEPPAAEESVGGPVDTIAHEAALEQIEALLPAFHSLVAEVAEWTDRRKPWHLTTDEDRKRLVATADRLAGEFRVFGTMPYSRHELHRLGTDTLRHMAHGDAVLWNRLPGAVREVVNRHEMMPDLGAGQHRMLGKSENGMVPLLRLVDDDFMYLRLDRPGGLGFWMRPEQIEAGAWAEAKITRAGG